MSTLIAADARPTISTRLTAIARWTIRVTGPVQVLVGIAFWLGRAAPLQPAHMLVGMLFDLAFVSLVVLAAVAGMRRTVVLAGIALAVVIPVFGVVQPRILPGPEHWIVRTAHLLLGVIAMVMAARLARFADAARAARTAAARGEGPTRFRPTSEPLPHTAAPSGADARAHHGDVAGADDRIARQG